MTSRLAYWAGVFPLASRRVGSGCLARRRTGLSETHPPAPLQSRGQCRVVGPARLKCVLEPAGISVSLSCLRPVSAHGPTSAMSRAPARRSSTKTARLRSSLPRPGRPRGPCHPTGRPVPPVHSQPRRRFARGAAKLGHLKAHSSPIVNRQAEDGAAVDAPSVRRLFQESTRNGFTGPT